MRNPVTIITTAYKRGHTLPETIDSVLGQGYENLEYIVLDDGSTDETPDHLSPQNKSKADFSSLIRWYPRSVLKSIRKLIKPNH